MFDMTKLNEITAKILNFYYSKTCPCAFPRFVDLVNFNYKDYQNGFIINLPSESFINNFQEIKKYRIKDSLITEFDRKENNAILHYFECEICNSIYRYTKNQYISEFEYQRLQIIKRMAKLTGPKINFPFILPGGLSALKDGSLKNCRKKYIILNSFNKFYEYMIKI